MIFLHPIYLLLAVPLGVSLVAWGFRLRWLLLLRVTTLALVVLALAGLNPDVYMRLTLHSSKPPG